MYNGMMLLCTCLIQLEIRSVERGRAYLPYSHVHNQRTVSIMAGCITHARNGHIFTFCLKSDVSIVFLDPNFLQDTEISAIRP